MRLTRQAFMQMLSTGAQNAPPPISHRAWAPGETRACAVVTGLRVIQKQFVLPESLQQLVTSSPIVPFDEAVDVFAGVAPECANAGILEPLLAQVMWHNDLGGTNGAAYGLYVLFETIAERENFRPSGDLLAAPETDGCWVLGSELMYPPETPIEDIPVAVLPIGSAELNGEPPETLEEIIVGLGYRETERRRVDVPQGREVAVRA